MKKTALIAAAAASAFATPALANTTDYSTLTNAVNFSSVITALLAVAAVMVGVLIVRKGIRFVLGSLR